MSLALERTLAGKVSREKKLEIMALGVFINLSW